MDRNLAARLFSLIQEGELKLAEKKCKKALKQGADAADCYNFLAVIELHRNNLKRAELHARESQKLRSENVSSLNTLAIVLKEQKRFDEALSYVNRALLITPGQVDLSLNKIDFLVSLQEIDEAIEICSTLYESHPHDARVGYKLVQTKRLRGGHDKAPEIMQSLLEEDPENVDYLLELSSALDGMNRQEEAIPILARAVERPDPDFRLLIEFARMQERTNNLQLAEHYAKLALAQDEFNSRILLILAKIHRRKAMYEEALQYLRVDGIEFDSDALRAEFEYEKGNVCDSLGQRDEAFRCWSKGNSMVREVHRLTDTPWWREPSLNYKQLPDQQTIQKFAHPDYSPVFMIGFPRSGTTLLHTLVDQHSLVRVENEGPAISETLNKLEEMRTAHIYPANILHLGNKQVETLSEVYMETLGVDGNSGLVIDQSPLNGMHIPLILTMFEKPKFIFSVRHPYDVCLSAFMQNFSLNMSTFEFLDLESTVRFYELVMNIWIECLDVFQFDWCAVKYEDLVRDRAGELRRVTDFLNLEWEAGILDEEKRIESHKLISTVSYQQVNKPIYNDAVFRWKYYEKYLEPYKEVLAPFVEHFGYAE